MVYLNMTDVTNVRKGKLDNIFLWIVILPNVKKNEHNHLFISNDFTFAVAFEIRYKWLLEKN